MEIAEELAAHLESVYDEALNDLIADQYRER